MYEYSPEFDVEDSMEISLSRLKLYDRFNGKIHFEVIGKDENGIKIKIIGLNIYNQDKRMY